MILLRNLYLYKGQNMRILIVILIIYLANVPIYAQNSRSTISGHIFTIEKDGGKLPLPYSTISILQLPDSLFIAGTATNKQGAFKITYTRLKNSLYLLKASYTGMPPQYHTTEQIKSSAIDTIFLDNNGIILNEIVITAKQPDIQEKQDTTIINATAFKTPQNAYLHELIKRIPGINYDERSGKLSYNGKAIQAIELNGKPFFNRDTKVALDNLPAKFISKIRIYNKEDSKKLNQNTPYYILDLQTKEEFNGSFLNSVMAGYGTRKKQSLEGQSNYFEKDGDNISLILNRSNKELNTLYGKNMANSLGLNFYKNMGGKFDMSGNIHYTKNTNNSLSNIYREEYLPKGNLYSFSTTFNENNNQALNSSFYVGWKPNTKTSLVIDFGYTNNRTDNNSEDKNLILNHFTDSIQTDWNTIPDRYKVNSNRYESRNKSWNKEYQWLGIWKQDIDKRWKANASIQYIQRQNKNKNLSQSAIHYYQNANDSLSDSNQYTLSPGDNTEMNASINLIQTVKKDFILKYAYDYHFKKEQTMRNIYDLMYFDDPSFDINKLPADYQKGYVDSLSNNSHSKTNTHKIEFNLSYQTQRWRMYAQLTYSPLQRNIKQKTGETRTDTTIYSSDIKSSLSVGWRSKKDFAFTVFYDGNTAQPPLSILLPVRNTNNPLYVIQGNPNLKRKFIHSIAISMRITGLSLYTDYKFISNDITQKITYNPQTGYRETYPININGNNSLTSTLQWNKTTGDFSFNINENISYNNRISFIGSKDKTGADRSKTREFGIVNKFQTAYRPDWGSIELTGEYFFKQSQNSLQQTNVFSRDYKVGITGHADLFKNFQINSDFSYTYRNGTVIDQNYNSEILWNFGITLLLFKNKSAELSFYWADILKQRKDYMRNVTTDSFYEYHIQQIPGYMLFSLKYNFNIQP